METTLAFEQGKRFGGLPIERSGKRLIAVRAANLQASGLPDAWFANPFADVLDRLQAEGYDDAAVAEIGDRLEDLAYQECLADRQGRALAAAQKQNLHPFDCAERLALGAAAGD